jgi:hypothetical protein
MKGSYRTQNIKKGYLNKYFSSDKHRAIFVEQACRSGCKV